MVGSVASRLWEVVKGNASWGFYYPVSIVRGVGGIGGAGQKEQQQQQEDDTIREVGAESSRALAVGSNLLQDHEYSYTNGFMANITSTITTAATSLPQRPSSSSSSRRSTLSAPSSPTKSRRRANTALTRKKPITALTATTVESSLKDVDTDPGLRASWVLVPQQEFTPTTASLSASASRPLPVARGINSNQSYSHSHSRSASTANALGKKRPFRYPVGAKPTTAHVSFEVPGAPGGRRARKKSLSWGGTGGWAGEKMVFGSGAGLGVEIGEGEEEDEVDESIRRWNERLREMIREGREALGSKVEVLYEDGL